MIFCIQCTLSEESLNQKAMWQDVLPQLRRYVVLRYWNVNFLAAHLHQKPQTIGSWLVGVRRPTGDCLVALWYVLHEFGFAMPGMDKLDETVRFAGRLFAFGAATQEDILRDFFKLGEAINRDLYQILRGDRKPRNIIDERCAYQHRLTHRIGEAFTLEQEATGTDTPIQQLVGAA